MGTAIANLSDEDLVDFVRLENQEDYYHIVERYEQKLMRYAHFILKDKDKAHDVVQEAFIKAFINLNSFDTSKKFSSWIYRITHNEAINYIKRHKREISLEDNEWVAETVAGSDNVSQEVADQEIIDELKDNVEKLPLLYREPLILKFFNDMSYREISDILRMPEGTVAIRINRGKSMLKKIVKQKKDD